MTDQKDILLVKSIWIKGKSQRAPPILSPGNRLLENPRIISLKTRSLLECPLDFLLFAKVISEALKKFH